MTEVGVVLGAFVIPSMAFGICSKTMRIRYMSAS